MYVFDLPVGGIITMDGRRFYHKGNGEFVGMEKPPFFLEESSSTPGPKNDVVLRWEAEDVSVRHRCVRFCDTQEMLDKHHQKQAA